MYLIRVPADRPFTATASNGFHTVTDSRLAIENKLGKFQNYHQAQNKVIWDNFLVTVDMTVYFKHPN
jgi:hypothetical protein